MKIPAILAEATSELRFPSAPVRPLWRTQGSQHLNYVIYQMLSLAIHFLLTFEIPSEATVCDFFF